MKFYDVNDAIQKWGQAKQGREFMNNLLRLLDREECDEWLMSGRRYGKLSLKIETGIDNERRD